MRYEIRAMSFSEILDMSFRLVRDHFGLLVGITSIAYVPLAVATAMISPAPGHAPGGFEIATMVTLFLVVVLVTPIVWAAVTLAIGAIYLGRSATVGGSLRSGLSLSLPLIGTMTLSGLAIMLGFLLLIIPGLYFAMAYLLVEKVVVLEGTSGMAALRRSRTLMRGNLLRGYGVVTVGGLIIAVLTGVISFALGFVPFLGPIGVGVARAVGMAYTSAVAVVLYFDIRCRKEAFDLEHLTQLVASAPAPIPTA